MKRGLRQKKATESQEKERTLFFVSYSADNARTVQYHGYIIDFIFRLSQKNQLEIFFTSFHFVSFWVWRGVNHFLRPNIISGGREAYEALGSSGNKAKSKKFEDFLLSRGLPESGAISIDL